MLRASLREWAHARRKRPHEAERQDLLFLSDLKRALRQPGCPLCRLVRDEDRHYLVVFLREGKDDGRMLLRLLGSWGLCARHAGALVYLDPVEHGDGLGTGTLYDWLLGQARRVLDGLRQECDRAEALSFAAWQRRPKPGRNVQRGLRRMAHRQPCPACEAREWQAGYVTERFFRALEPAVELPEIAALYLASDGLCLPHWRTMPAYRPSAAVAALVSNKQQGALALLRTALDTVFASEAAGGSGKAGDAQNSICAAALSGVAGDTTWTPTAKSAQPAR